MSAERQTRRETEAPADSVEREVGELLDVQTRTAQTSGGGGISTNITDYGRRTHGVDEGDELVICVATNGIWIPFSTDE